MSIKEKIFFILNIREKKLFLLLGFFTVIASLIEVISVSLIIPAASIIIDYSNIEKIKASILPFLNSEIKDSLDDNFLFLFVIFSVGVFIFKYFFMYLLVYSKMKYISNIIIRISQVLYKSYISRPYSFHLKNSTSQLIYNVNSETQNFAQGFLSPLLEIIIELVIILGLIILLFIYEPIGSLLIISISFVAGYLFHNYTHLKALARGKQRRISEIKGLKIIQQGLSGIKELIIYSKKNFFLREYYIYNLITYNLITKQQTLVDTSKYFIELVAIFSVILLIFFLITFQSAGLVLIKLSLFGIIFFKILPALNRIISAKQRISFSLVSLDNIYKEMKNFSLLAINEKKNAKEILFKKKIELKNISYSYDGRTKILENLNLNINKGETIGILGQSGSGKSTIINILVGFLKPSIGEILVDNVSLNSNQKLEMWQKRIAYVPQSFFMLEDSIRSNIVFEPNFAAKVHDKKILSSLKKAQILNYVESLPKKLGTLIGERGAKISVGQAQRLSLARALYKSHDLLVLDEATSALDIKNQNKIMEVLKKIKTKKTIIIITHDKSILSICDKVYRILNKKLYKN